MWRRVIEECIMEKIETLEEDYSEHYLKEFVAWEEEVIEPFVFMALNEGGVPPKETSVDGRMASGASRAERDRWCTDLKRMLLVNIVRARMKSFWDIMVDFPDSVPALEDMQSCIQFCSETTLKEELITTVRGLLATRLHRAGTRTEDILTMLVKTIHSLCVILSKNEQHSVILSVISNTLDHMRKRRDCIPAIVQVITHPNSFYGDADWAPPKEDGAEEVGDDLKTGAGGQPDVLKILLTAINIKPLVEEYRQSLALQLLSKDMHDFDTTTEEEALERLKCVFGEDVLSSCTVMVRDIQMSRRITVQLRNMAKEQNPTFRGMLDMDGDDDEEEEVMGRGSIRLGVEPTMLSRSNAPDPSSVSVDVLSMTAWPAKLSAASDTIPIPSKYKPHPVLQTYMDNISEKFEVFKRDQRLCWILNKGKVAVEVKQKDMEKNEIVSVPHTLSIFHASVVFYMKDHEGTHPSADLSLASLASQLDVSPEELKQQLASLTPHVVEGVTPSGTVRLQKVFASGKAYTFAEAEEEEEDAPPPGISPEQINVIQRMVLAMLKTQKAAKSLNEIHNSLKMFGQFEGSADDLKSILQKFVRNGSISMTEGKLYTFPK
ncbi:anaphase-promoting complex subunit 2 [Angomonas deanei]|nr:anaphase-promoting complex subunit 2 [Angomonas deanei]|eukprot:EPY30773.1 anaphase-promoting complex subunit 2 [Angomonas deanei]